MARQEETKMTTTPFGDVCIVPRGNEELENIINEQVKGCYQEAVARELIWEGCVIGYKADGDTLKGNAAKYQTHYRRSVEALMARITEALPEGMYLCSGEVGPRGAFGYYLTN
jgi:hypothetical protein